MILYVNGTGHTAGAEAATAYLKASDDDRLEYLQDLPHPDNIKVSWGHLVSSTLKSSLYCDARVGNTNNDIIEQTRKWLSENTAGTVLVIIEWSKFGVPVLNDQRTVWRFHTELEDQNIAHLFFNGDQIMVPHMTIPAESPNYYEPYTESYTKYLKNQGLDTVSPDSDYFDQYGHGIWHQVIVRHLIKNNLIPG